ncbi:UDP-glucuronosyltransferase [Pararhodonellum marinum]|uniref:UDP-glucuronosyltransferase n=1 Tax=Pararhodonellum marinum TaxID=2755358 RepID=UPI00293BAAA6|nr:UDP-glucuronosyltransferase [Pararhodonellum marinum]
MKLKYPESQWGEELSLYANALDGWIHFEVVDFYGNEYIINPEKVKTPLTLEEVILLIECLEVDRTGSHGNMQGTLYGIPEAESLIYPELKQYFEEKRKGFGLI